MKKTVLYRGVKSIGDLIMNKNFRRIFGVFILFGAFVLSISAQNEAKIEEIRKIYKETNEKIAESNKNGEFSTIYLNELIVNKNNGSYPAVGIFQTVVKFYYTFGDREINPYPNRLLKIEIETKRSANTEKNEFLFNEKEKLIFYFESANETEKRLYFENETAIKCVFGEKSQDLNSEETKSFAKHILSEKKNLFEFFKIF